MAGREEEFDIVVVGAGPAGLMLSTCLARWGWKIKHIERRPLPTARGRADGIQPRTLDSLKNLGLKKKLMLLKPARVFEVAFWNPRARSSSNGEAGQIERTGTWPSCPDFIQARYPYTALIHQGHIEQLFISDIEAHGTRIDRPCSITGFTVDNSNRHFPIEVRYRNLDSNVETSVRSKYLFGGDGGNSFVRQQLGIPMQYKDPIRHLWAVMDGTVTTNFPDIKLKCTIHSDSGSIMIIPRENNMVRLYIQIAEVTKEEADSHQWQPRSAKEVQEAARKILQPYNISWQSVDWYSIYPIGQGIASKYTLDQRVFIGGDACHTHSPKAGQGMNTAFQDALNLAWKLNLVEAGIMKRDILETYEHERRHVAEVLLDFDRKYANLFSSQTQSTDQKSEGADSNAFEELFKTNCQFTSGFGATYDANVLNYDVSMSHFNHPLIITGDRNHKVRPGGIFPSSDVTRLVDANPVALESVIDVNSTFRLFVYAGQLRTPADKSFQDLNAFMRAFLADPVLNNQDLKQNFISVALILAAKRSEVDSKLISPWMDQLDERIFADDVIYSKLSGHAARAPAHHAVGFSDGHIHDPAIVLVRPDGHIAIAISLKGAETVEALRLYFKPILSHSGLSRL